MADEEGRRVDVGRLCTAMQRSRKMLQKFREERREMVRQFVGHHWSEEGTSERVPVNLISLYVSVVGRNLIAKTPRVMLSTFDRGMKPAVAAMEAWANKEVERTKLQDTLQRAVTDALFSVGIVKVALATPADSASAAWGLGAGQPFAERVDLDDFVFDTHARDFAEVSFIGHRYRAPLDVVRDSPLYHASRKDLSASSDNPYNLEGDERVSTLGRGVYGGSDADEFEEFVDLWEVYLPRHRLVLTLADDHLTGAAAGPGELDALRTQRWLGPAVGPYHILPLGIVPGNAMPKGPIQDLLDLHEAANRSYRKLIRSTDRTKEVAAVAGGAMEDGSRIMQADDGDIIRVDNPERIKQMVFGGSAGQHVLAVATTMKDLFGYMAGNLDIMGGLSPQSKTATQDKMLNENSSHAVADMQDRTVSFTAGVVKALCWYWWNDPFLVQKSKHSLPGLPNLQIERRVTPQMRARGNFDDMDIRVDPYSMQHSTPQARMAALNQVVQQVVMPMMQLLQQRGIAFDVNAYLEKIGKYMDMPDLADLMTIQPPPQVDSQTGGGAGEEPGMPAATSREYVRHNVPASTREASDRNLVSSLMGVDPGGSQSGAKNGVH